MDKEILRKKILSTLNDFNSEWNSVEDFRKFAREFIHLKKALYDGWYCIDINEFYDVYYQERGCKHWHIYRFNDSKKALTFAISCSQDLRLDIKEDQRLSASAY
jgi:hypothetical protein